MVGVNYFVTFCLCTDLIVKAATNDNIESATMKQQLTHLEETVSNLQKHIVAQDQKQTAVLSSVLSRLTVTTDELAKLQHNYTVLEHEFSSLKENGKGKGLSRQEVAFEANMAMKGERNHVRTFQNNSRLLFPTIQYNDGGCWNSSTGVFTATVNGTYLFWIDLTFTAVDSFTLFMRRNDRNFGKAFGRLPNPAETTMTSRISMTQLVEGDLVDFIANKDVNYLPNVSSCGGILLYSGVQ